MKVYVDPNATDEPQIMGFKAQQVEHAAFYCPYIPLQMSGSEIPSDPEVEQIGSEPAVFRLRCEGDVYLPKAERAFHWVMENVPVEQRLFENETVSTGRYSSTSHILLTIKTDELASLFKLFCM